MSHLLMMQPDEDEEGSNSGIDDGIRRGIPSGLRAGSIMEEREIGSGQATLEEPID
jgi:hypothetical protein